MPRRHARVYERAGGGVLYLETRQGGAKRRKSLGHRDRALAEGQARQVAQRLAELRHAGHMGPVPLEQVFRLYFTHRAPLLSAKRQQNARTAAKLFTAHLGPTFLLEHLGQTDLDRYAAARKAGRLSPTTPREGSAPRAVRNGTVGQELRWLSAVCQWARGFRVGGKRLLGENPLVGLARPQEANPRRPVASEDRYRKTLVHADAVDPLGRLRCMLALARYTGRRENAICQLRAADVLLTREQVLRALAATGLDERQAEYMPHGAIHWRPDADKRSYEEVTAISRATRAALEAYLRDHPRVAAAPLFPAATDDARPINKDVASRLLVEAERRAKLPKLEVGRWHPYRRLFAVEGKHLPDVDLAKAAGWRDLRTMKQAYQRSDPATVLRVIENAGAGLTSDTPPERSGNTPTT